MQSGTEEEVLACVFRAVATPPERSFPQPFVTGGKTMQGRPGM